MAVGVYTCSPEEVRAREAAPNLSETLHPVAPMAAVNHWVNGVHKEHEVLSVWHA
jgi:hypothetical protein